MTPHAHIFKSAAGFRLVSRPGGAWRVHLNTVPLWVIFMPWILSVGGLTWWVVQGTLANGYSFTDPLMLVPMGCIYVILSMPLFVTLPYIVQVLTGQCTVEFDTVFRTITLPVLAHRKASNPREIIGIGRITLNLDECAGVRVVPWSNDRNSVDPWNPYRTDTLAILSAPEPIQYRLEMQLKRGDPIPFAFYFPRNATCWVKLTGLEKLAGWFNQALELSPQTAYAPPPPTPQEAARIRPLPLGQSAAAVLAGALALGCYVAAYVQFSAYIEEVPMKLTVLLGILAAAAGYSTVDTYFRKIRANSEAAAAAADDHDPNFPHA